MLRRCFLLFMAATLVLPAAWAAEPPAQDNPPKEKDERKVWESSDKNAKFIAKSRKKWEEQNKDGEVVFRFIEKERTDEYIDIYDQTRGYTLRIYKTEMMIKGGNEGYNKFEEFTKLYDGEWVKEVKE